MKVKRWRKKATETKIWAKIVWEAEVLGRLWRQGVSKHFRSERNFSHCYLFLM
jgi:hypothetical protein